MTLPTREELLALDHTHNGLPFVRVVAKTGVSEDTTTKGLPFLVFGESGGGGPEEPAAHPPTYLAVVASDVPISATTIARETGDVLLTGDGFTLIEETGSVPSNPATIEWFASSNPTTGDWVLGRDYLTNAPMDTRLRSPSPIQPGDEFSANLTLVLTAPNTFISFEWGIFGQFFPPDDSDAFHFYIDEVQQWFAYPPGNATVSRGTYSFTLPAGTYDLRWSITRPTDFVTTSNNFHAWITALIIDPNF